MPDQLSSLPVAVIDPEDWLGSSDRFSGEWQGGASGSGISIIANHIVEVGGGAKLHRHDYAEVFLVRRGRVTFEVGDETIEAREGQILVVPAGVPHAFHNPGPEPFEMIDIHESGEFETEWL
jgi:mannose-6-phosphate isomerase-like protein (cupin superfamily)